MILVWTHCFILILVSCGLWFFTLRKIWFNSYYPLGSPWLFTLSNWFISRTVLDYDPLRRCVHNSHSPGPDRAMDFSATKMGGFLIVIGVPPSSLDGLCHGKSHENLDDGSRGSRMTSETSIYFTMTVIWVCASTSSDERSSSGHERQRSWIKLDWMGWSCTLWCLFSRFRWVFHICQSMFTFNKGSINL